MKKIIYILILVLVLSCTKNNDNYGAVSSYSEIETFYKVNYIGTWEGYFTYSNKIVYVTNTGKKSITNAENVSIPVSAITNEIKNFTSHSLAITNSGRWKIGFKVCVSFGFNVVESGYLECEVGLSTSNNTFSNNKLKSKASTISEDDVTAHYIYKHTSMYFGHDYVTISTPTTYYLNTRIDGNDTYDVVTNGSSVTTEIYAERLY